MQIRKVEGMRFKVKDAVTLYCVVKCNDETWKSGHATAKGGKDHLFNVRGSRASRVVQHWAVLLLLLLLWRLRSCCCWGGWGAQIGGNCNTAAVVASAAAAGIACAAAAAAVRVRHVPEQLLLPRCFCRAADAPDSTFTPSALPPSK